MAKRKIKRENSPSESSEILVPSKSLVQFWKDEFANPRVLGAINPHWGYAHGKCRARSLNSENSFVYVLIS